MTFIGIDPGFMGAVAVLRSGGHAPQVYDMPIIEINGRRSIDIPALHEIIVAAASEAWSPAAPDSYLFALVEHAQVFTGEGVKSCFSIGYGFGVVEACLAVTAVPYDLVKPREWQKPFGVRGKGVDSKALAFAHARRMFPSVTFHTPRGRELDGRADALLIARYAQMTHTREGV